MNHRCAWPNGKERKHLHQTNRNEDSFGEELNPTFTINDILERTSILLKRYVADPVSCHVGSNEIDGRICESFFWGTIFITVAKSSNTIEDSVEKTNILTLKPTGTRVTNDSLNGIRWLVGRNWTSILPLKSMTCLSKCKFKVGL